MTSPIAPTPEDVQAQITEFDLENAVLERALRELFDRYPTNADEHTVLLKVVCLNRLYNTKLFAVHDMARHINKRHDIIDRGIRDGSAEIVALIAVLKTTDDKERNNYSFATKFCSWHRPELFPIYDSRVDEYLWAMKKQHKFCAEFRHRYDLYEYKSFRKIVEAFREFFGIKRGVKDLDKFLYKAGEKLLQAQQAAKVASL
jgi:hypothetical protein